MSTIAGPDGVYWGELPALPGGFRLERSLGFAPGVATMRVFRSQVASWVAARPPAQGRWAKLGGRAPAAAALAAALTDAAPKRFTPAAALPYRADLTIANARGGRVETVRLADYYLREARVVEGGTFDTDDVLELTLTDVRRFWADHGVVIGREWNVPDGKTPEGTPRYTEGVPTDLAAIVRELLLHLPGQPALVRFLDRDPGRLRAVRCHGASPLEALSAVLAAEGLAFTLTLAGGAACWALGEGRVGEQGTEADHDNGAVHDFVTGTGAFTGLSPRAELRTAAVDALDAPDEVVVVGARPVYSVAVELEPVLPRERHDGQDGVKREWLPLELALPVMRAGAPPRDPVAQSSTPAPRAPTALDLLLAQLSPPGGASQPEVVPDRAADDAKWLLYKAPLYGDDEWPAEWDDVLPDDRQLLREGLWRWWRVPEWHRWLLPVLDRAERSGAGVRRTPLVTGGRWSSEVERVGPDDPAYATLDARNDDEKQLALIMSEQARIGAQIAAREAAFRKAVQDAWHGLLRLLPLAVQRQASALYQRLGPELQALIGPPPPDPPSGAPVPLPGLVEDVLVRALLGNARILWDDLRALITSREYREERLAQLGEIAQGTFFRDYVAQHGDLARLLLGSLLGISDTDALHPEAGETEALERRRVELGRQAQAPRERIVPGHALRVQLLDVAGRFTSGGGTDVALAQQVATLQQQIAAAEQDARRARRELRVVAHVNWPRGPVAATLVDADAGVWRLAEPSTWLAEAGVERPEETHLVPVPVRAVFGSWCLGTPGIPEPVPFVTEILEAASQQDGRLGGHLGGADSGDQVPSEAYATRERVTPDSAPLPKPGIGAGRGAGSGLTVFTFTRGDRKSGQAQLLGLPYRITAPDQVRVYVTLPTATQPEGASNLDAARVVAKGLADAVLDRPRASEGGTAVVETARPVQLNGRVTAVAWEWAPGAAGLRTTLAFDRVDGLGDLATGAPDVPQGDPPPLVVGFDPTEYR